MPKYLFIGSYTAEGARGVLKDGGTKRRDAAAGIMESLGGTLEAMYFGFGSDDFFIVADLPDHAAAAAGSMTTAASGTLSLRTVVLLTPEDLDQAVQRSPQWTPPGG